MLLGALGAVVAGACFTEPTAPVGEAPAQFISVRRAWRPGERDSLVAFIIRNGSWGQFSDLAAQSVPQWDSAVDVVLNPAWQPSAAPTASAPAPLFSSMGAQFQSSWGTAGVDVRIVYDSIPGGTVQRDSLNWKLLFWWNPADQTWKGYVVNATTTSTFAYVTLNTTSFNASGGKSGAGGGEARSRVDSATYWEANGGQWRVTYNGGYGALGVITSGPFTGGNIQTGQMGGALASVTMPRVSGTTPPASQTITFDFSGGIYSQRMFCYFTPVTPPTGYSQCTGVAIARLVAAARAHRLTARMAADLADSLFALPPAPRLARSGRRRWRRAHRSRSVWAPAIALRESPRRRPAEAPQSVPRMVERLGLLLARFQVTPAGGDP
jgi:hypothetical protein